MNSRVFHNRLYLLLIALAIAIVWIGVVATSLGEESVMAVVFFDIKANYPGYISYPFTLQNLMWLMFFIGLGELFYRYQTIRQSRGAIKNNYLSEDPTLFYTLEDVVDIRKVTYSKSDILANLLNVLTVRYQVSKSVDETHQMLNSQLELMQFKLDVDYNMIRYITWLIPTLGFIGTVIGIALALAAAGEPGAAESANFLAMLTTKLAVAFNTTLVALIMSAILVYIMHLVQGGEERMMHRCGEYCLNHFINKLM